MTLFETAASGDLDALKRGIRCEWQDFRARDRQGNTLLHYAVPSCGLDAVKYLTDYLNMDPLDANLRGVTPYDLALERGDRELLAWFEEKTGIAPQALVHNPVRRGFYPDPSWIRVGQDYYMVNSSFCFFPCLPISKSRDLVHWTTVGYALTNPEWARVYRSEGGRGYWAPDLSYDPHSGRYFITATYRGNENDPEPRCQMVTSAPRPEGPYEEPAWIHEDGIDPSLFHDEDGRHYMLFNRSVRMVELSTDCRTTVGEPRLIWGGDWKVKTEGPQMMKHNGYYYILAAEGGTGAGHRISVARSKEIWGPYETCPYNPILRQDDPGGYLQNCGHGKLLQTADGRWYLCYLCLRRDGASAPMGRETAIAEVDWTADGWPVVRHGRRPATVLALPVDAPAETAAVPAGLVPWKYGEWVTPRALDADRAVVQEDTLLLRGNGLDLCETAGQGVLLVRQQERDFSAEVVVDTAFLANAAVGNSAGLTCYYDEHSYLKFGVQKTGTGACLLFEEYVGYEKRASEQYPLPVHDGHIRLKVTAGRGERIFAAQSVTTKVIPEPAYLTSEGLKLGKRFTGAMVGVYVHGRMSVRFTQWNTRWDEAESKE